MVDDIVDKVIKKQYYYTPLDEETLKKEFYGKSGKSQGGKIEYAYQRACELRDFEIDKFWMRSKYFWGFVSVILGAYAAIVQSDYVKKIQNGEMPNLHFDFCLLIMGFLCSIVWLLVLWGSKAWYEHWELMICFLEDDITGPLYKTGTYRKSRKNYSVSKLNIMLAWIYIIAFLGLLILYVCGNYAPAIHIAIDSIDWFVTIALCVTVVVSIILFFGYPKCDRISEDKKGKDTFYNQWEDTCDGCRKPHCIRDCSKTPPHKRRTCF
jgi:hypothetical protein